MKELNLAEILKDCPKGAKLYSPIFGEVEFIEVKDTGYAIMIEVMAFPDTPKSFYSDGKYNTYYSDSEVTLFPSKDNHDWSTFKVKKPKFDIRTLQPFDKVLVRNDDNEEWKADLYSHRRWVEDEVTIFSISDYCDQCIPYNEDTKHLIGRLSPAPEFYVTWEK